MKYKGLIVATLLVATPLCATAEGGVVSNSKEVTFSIISPQDGSLWIATESHGLIRLGATGRTFSYSSASGDFPCDSIAALAFGANGTLYMKDVREDVYSYTTLSGFTIQKELPADVVFETVSVEESALDSTPDLPTPYWHHPTWPCWLVIAILCAGVVFLSLRLLGLKRENSGANEPERPNKALSRGNSFEESGPSEERPIIVNSDFVARVESLVAEHFTDPNYSVETMADEIGITRVHLNRKLKEAGAPAPKMILKKARMEKALTMLREGLPVSDVYAVCGFSSASYFSSAFKEFFGYTPSDVTKPNI